MALWVVKGGSQGEREAYNLENGVSTLGWAWLGDLTRLTTPEEIRASIQPGLSAEPRNAVSNWTAQIFSFAHQIEPGDLIAMPLIGMESVAFGQVVGPYAFDPEVPEEIGPHKRPVRWTTRPIARADIDQDILRSIRGGRQTIF